MNEIAIENLGLEWSAPRRSNSSRGQFVRSAIPTPTFWTHWRADKAAVKSLGIVCVPGSGPKSWEVLHFFNESVAGAVTAQEAAAPAVQRPSGKLASRLLDFQAPPLDSSKTWSPEQLAIFDWFRSGTGNAEVLARAGTGKTTTIKAGFSQAPEEEILYAVFNKKNQVEAQAAISDSRVDVKTLHAVGYRLIRQVWHNAKPDDDVEYDRIRAALGASAHDDVVVALKQLVGFAKNMFVSPSIEDLADLADARGIDPEVPNWDAVRLAQAAVDVLNESKKRDSEGRISFNDMVWLPVAQGWVHPLYDLVCVDEAQDMNLPQLLMASGLVREGGRVCVVGDDRQAIYGFRGAAQNGMRLMQERLNASVLGLTTTYRCPQSVVALAAEIVKDYRAADSAPVGAVNHIGDGLLLDAVKIGDAILSRANAPLLPICLKLLRRGVTARIEGKDIGKTLAGIAKKIRGKSVPHFIAQVNAWGNREKSRAKRGKHFETRCEVINDQVGCLIAVAEGASNVEEIQSRLLSMFQDSEGFAKPAVVLSSVHKAKGLEWSRVFLIAKTFRPNAGDEEANIYYVAVTRAKSELTFVSEDKPTEN